VRVEAHLGPGKACQWFWHGLRKDIDRDWAGAGNRSSRQNSMPHTCVLVGEMCVRIGVVMW
jgi:hypothetical protein